MWCNVAITFEVSSVSVVNVTMEILIFTDVFHPTFNFDGIFDIVSFYAM